MESEIPTNLQFTIEQNKTTKRHKTQRKSPMLIKDEKGKYLSLVSYVSFMLGPPVIPLFRYRPNEKQSFASRFYLAFLFCYSIKKTRRNKKSA